MTRSVETTSPEDSELSLPGPKERRRLREAAELTHDEVAAAVGVTAATVRSWESGRTAPRGRKREVYTQFLARLAARRHDGGPAGAPGEAKPADAAEEPAADPPVPDPPTPQGPISNGPSPHPQTTDGPSTDGPTSNGPTSNGPTSTGPTSDAPAEPDQLPDQLPAEAPTEAPVRVPVPGPAEAFDALYARAAGDLARQAYLLTGRRALALEAVEKAFVQAWDRWPEVAADPDPVGWVRAIAYEYALSPWHRFRRAHRHLDKPPAEPADRILLDALLSLSPANRRTVLLYDGVGLDLPDTAAETEATTPTAGNRLVHAHADLADRIPELADVPLEKQSALLRHLITALRPAGDLEPRPAAVVRGGGERRTRMWTRATLSLTAMIAVSTSYTLMTAPTHYEPPLAPGESVSGVPPLAGPQQLTERGKQLHDKLRADPEAGPARVAPLLE
ncbi:DNA-directed RNA polymerase specialized sigma24 family protein [Streptomyces sp. CG 926]|uniref:helix-turn-helix domain-containing protein n=1 Tax=Streptomyces sp. CG 926 TaxID=1882405 RepID=UPI000D6D7869|nr:helix-turn-helix domain-containing protein [Streptomyces sp. CG 926]PWK63005.1 DNA-directed RNA polymerase specialized sigma24 family protein [Streptomyces sp. CG 926]